MERTAKLDLDAVYLEVLLGLLNLHIPDTAVWAYGSRVSGKARKYSDLDLVAFADTSQDKQITDLKEAFEESNLPFRVELFVWDEIPEHFHNEIQNNHIELTESPKSKLPKVHKPGPSASAS